MTYRALYNLPLTPHTSLASLGSPCCSSNKSSMLHSTAFAPTIPLPVTFFPQVTQGSIICAKPLHYHHAKLAYTHSADTPKLHSMFSLLIVQSSLSSRTPTNTKTQMLKFFV